MRLFVEFVGKKAQGLENLCNCVFIDESKLTTVFDLATFLKHKFYLQQHYILSFWISNYHISHLEPIGVFRDSDYLSVRVSKLKSRELPYPISHEVSLDASVNSDLPDTASPMQTEAVDISRPTSKPEIHHQAVAKKQVFLPRKFALAQDKPRCKLNLNSNPKIAPSRKEVINKHDVADQQPSSSKSEMRTNAKVNKEITIKSLKPNANSVGNTSSLLPNKEKFCESSPKIANEQPLQASIDHPVIETSPPAKTELKKGHIVFSDKDDDDEMMEVPRKSYTPVDYSPIVKPVYVEPAPLSNSRENVSQSPASPESGIRQTSHSLLANRVLDQYNKKMELLANEKATEEDESESSDSEDEDDENDVTGTSDKHEQSDSLNIGKMPGLNMASVVSQLNMEIIKAKNAKVTISKPSNNSHVTPKSDSNSKESLEDMLRRSREHIANSPASKPSSVSEVKSAAQTETEKGVTDKRKLDICEPGSALNGTQRASTELGGKKQKLDLSDEEGSSDESESEDESSEEEEEATKKQTQTSSHVKPSGNALSNSQPQKDVSYVNAMNNAYAKLANNVTVVPSKDAKPTANLGHCTNEPASSSSSDDEDSTEKKVREFIKSNRGGADERKQFGAVWFPKAEREQKKAEISSPSSRNYKAKPNKSWCLREPQTNKSVLLTAANSSSNNNESEMLSVQTAVDMVTDIRKSVQLYEPKIGDPISFKILELDSNFRPDLVSKQAKIKALNSGVVTVEILDGGTSNQPDKLSKRAEVFQSMEDGNEGETALASGGNFLDYELKVMQDLRLTTICSTD